METKVLEWKNKEEAVKLLQEGEVVCFPTETVYGMGAISTKKEAFEKLAKIKRRPPTKPFTLMCSCLADVARYAEVDVRSIAVMKKYMPGQITLLLKARPGLPEWVTLGTPLIGVRVPDSKELLDLIDKVGAPLLVPSANISGELTSTTFEQTYEVFKSEVPAIIKGECTSMQASTIVNMGGPEISLVREGPIPFAEIKAVADQAKMSVSIGCDHGAFFLKENIVKHLECMGIKVLDEGTFNTFSCDYPEFARKAAQDVANGSAELGIVCCTSGEGVMITANKVHGIRCGMGYDDDATGKTRSHNNANMVSFGAKYMKEEDVLRRVDIFLSEKFSVEEKHHRRVSQIEC